MAQEKLDVIVKAIELYENLTKAVNSVYVHNQKEFNKELIKPKFL